MQTAVSTDTTHPARPGIVAINAAVAKGLAPEPAKVLAFPPIYHDGVVVQRHQRSWSHLSATLDHVESNSGLDMTFDSEVPSLSVILEEVGGSLVIRHGPGSRGDEGVASVRSGPISVLPAGFTARGSGKQMRFLRHLSIQFDEKQLKSVAEDSGVNSDRFVPNLMFGDQNVGDVARLIASECQSAGWSGLFYGDSLSSVMMVALARVQPHQPAPVARGGLTPTQLRRTQGHMLQNLAESVTLRELADIANISLAHFCRAFKVSTGKAPHQWMIDARIEKAKSLLVDKGMSIAQVALALGFCDQAHFTRTFSKAVGVTPLIWQRS